MLGLCLGLKAKFFGFGLGITLEAQGQAAQCLGLAACGLAWLAWPSHPRLVYRAVCTFTPQLVLIAPTRGGMARLS